MYQLWPPDEWYEHMRKERPTQKKDRYGNLMYEEHPRPGTDPRPLLDFPILANIDKVYQVPIQLIPGLYSNSC